VVKGRACFLNILVFAGFALYLTIGVP
jgi:hypothetical protein